MIKNVLGKQKKELLFWVLFGVASLFLFWKTQYGYATLDEAFYLNIPYRFLLGDRILFDEWSNTQLAAVPLLPVMKIYISLVGSADGIYFFIRILYTIVKIGISLLIVYKLQRYDRFAAEMAALFFLLSASYGLMVVSYNTLAFGGTLCFALFLITDRSKKKRWVSYFFAGISISIAVLGLPYVALIFIAYLITAFFLFYRVNKEKSDWMYMFSSEAVWGVIAGVVFSIALFCVYVFMHASLEDIVRTIPYILTSDPAHQAKNPWKIIPGFLSRIVMRNEKNIFTLALYVLAVIELVRLVKWKYDIKNGKKDKQISGGREKNHTVFSCAIACLLLFSYFFDHGYINYLIYVPNVLAVFLYIIYSEIEPVKSIFNRFWPIGMILMFVEYLGSNTGFDGMAASSCVASVGSVFIIAVALKKNLVSRATQNHRRIWDFVTFSLGSFLILNLVLLAYLRYTYVFWQDGGLRSLTTRINRGPQKGLIVTANDADNYNSMLDDMRTMYEQGEWQDVLILSDQSLWMVGKYHFATYSPLNYAISTGADMFFQYYEEHPEHIPDAIYADFLYEDIAKCLADKYDLFIQQGREGIIALPHE